jgi:hypothetical protein
MPINTFPYAQIDLRDDSTRVVPDPTIIPIHLPLFFSFAESGPVGLPVLGGTNTLTQKFGNGIIDERSIYYTHQNVFLKQALPFQQVYFVRLADPAAVAASLVLLCTVTPGLLTQYQRNSDGSLIHNSQGNPIPAVQSDGVTIVTQPGVTLNWTVRALASGETFSTVATITTTNGGVTSTTYPVMGFVTDVGAAGNSVGFRLFYTSAFDPNVVANINAMTFSFQPVMLNALFGIQAPVYDINNSQTQTFSFKDSAFDASTATYYRLADVLRNDYNTTTGLPYQVHAYSANVGAIGAAILAVSPELTGTDPYMFNIMSGLDQAGNIYEHMTVTAGSNTVLNSAVVNYLQGGSDGSLSNATLETQVVALLSGALNPLVGDAFRFPFTHIYDSGFTLATKQAMFSIFSLRDDVGIDLSTQDHANPPNTLAQDQSTGSALRAAALLYPESTDFGTGACRVSIYQQCALLAGDTLYTTPVPATLHRLLTRCAYNGTDHVTGEPKGRPQSEVTVFDITTLNWTPSTAQQMQRSWDTGLNYMQYCDIATVFYADLLSVYVNQTSLLSGDVMKDYSAIYLKRIIRRQWTNIVGRDDPPASLFKSIADAIDASASYVFGGRISTTTVVSQTAVDTALGYQLTVTTTVSGNPTNRVWKVIVPITRA